MALCCGIENRPAYKGSVKNEIGKDGKFVRQGNLFATPFGDGEGKLKVEPGRYKLYWAKSCHWSNRASIVRELLGLENVLDVQIVGREDVGGSNAWTVTNDNGDPDEKSGYRYLYEYYEAAYPGFPGRATVPTVVDQIEKKAVNNDYHKLTNYFETAFKKYQKKDAPDLYPAELRDEIDSLNEWLFPNVNNATYRMMFARSLQAYNEAYEDYYKALDYLEERLEKNRFLFGDYVTDSDVRLYVTLVRWETAYYRFLGTAEKGLRGYKNLWAYVRDLYVIPAFKHNTYLSDIAHEYGAIDESNTNFATFNYRFWNEVDYEKIYSEPQNRRDLSKDPANKFKINND
ncbi:MAG: glutathione S-transferase C-terminal domain-containing protein [Lachnospiraceae bacterium]|nr:glutathione S-transferase C-terminal domain-containing protein [Lachnospiraceae bacterium]